MNWAIDHKGSVALTIVVIVLGVFLGLFIHSIYHPAYAVLGGAGNISAVDNPHNFSANSSGSAGVKAQSETQICIFCHTPHKSITTTSLLNGPLWNHTLSYQSYTVKTQGSNVYNTALLSNIILLTQPPTQPDGASKMCLSCHDGTISVGSTNVGNIAMVDDSCLSPEGMIESGCSAYIGLDLSKKHAVSVPMNERLIDNSIANCAGSVTTWIRYPWDTDTTCGGYFNENPERVKLRPTATTYGPYPGVRGGEGIPSAPTTFYSPNYSYGVQCSSCHDPHYWANAPTNSTGYKFLVIDFNNLCSSCHNNTCPSSGRTCF